VVLVQGLAVRYLSGWVPVYLDEVGTIQGRPWDISGSQISTTVIDGYF
jgi:hypothetical protein